MKRSGLHAVSLIATALFLVGAASAQTIAGISSVIDGDTIDIHGARIRLNGIDAPESGQTCTDAAGASYRCGQKAALALADILGRNVVTCEQVDTDRYGRIVATCSVDGVDVNRRMVQAGWALAFRRYSTAYVRGEDEARTRRVGVWQGAFDPPWEWRKSKSEPLGIAAGPPSMPTNSTCAIKGNISRKGERIYHAPGQRDYAKTKINAAAGERYFCSEAAARDAGWRPAQR